MANQHVVPRRGKWAVEPEGAATSATLYNTQAEAITAGRAAARREKSELLVHGRNGRIRMRNSYGNDPRRSKG